MAEFINVNGGYGSQTTEVYLKRVLVGNVESVSARLSAALERLGYDVIEEEPAIRGRRGARGWGTWYGSADILDYAMSLVIRLKPIGTHSTRATFDYMIKHPYLSKGEKDVLTREAEAITALATVRAADKLCAACGAESMDDSRFCRRCGAPMTSEQAELDVLRMAAETRAGHTSVVTGTMLSLAVIAVTVFAWISIAVKGEITSKATWKLLLFLGLISLFNVFVGACAWARLNRALKTKHDVPSVMPVSEVRTLSDNEAEALPPRRREASVIEGTTELLTTHKREKQPVPVKRDFNDTGSIN